MRHFAVAWFRRGGAALALGLCGFLTASPCAQLPQIPNFPKGKPPIPHVPSFDQFLQDKPPLTTELADADPDIPYLDDFNPEILAPLGEVPRDSQGNFLRVPGLFEFSAQSYCLHAGTYPPRKGDGFVYAPLKGPRAAVISKILRESVRHPEIAQQNIQLLLWGILAKAKVADMPAPVKNAAYALLSEAEIRDLNGGALGLIPDNVRSQITARLPEPARATFEADAKLRQLLSQAQMPDYAQFEQAAMLSGIPIAESSGIPAGRWNYDPGARVFLRFFPHSYPLTTVQRYYPQRFHLERDDKGRITLLANESGERIEVVYDDSVAPLLVPGEDALRGWAFKSVRFTSPESVSAPGAIGQASWTNVGWAWFGRASGRGRVGSSGPRFEDAPARYGALRTYLAQTQALAATLRRNAALGSPLGGQDDLLEIAQLRAALSRLPADSGSSARPQAHTGLAALAWMSRLDSLASSSTHSRTLPSDPPRLQLASFSPQTGSSVGLQDFGSSQITLQNYVEPGAAVPSGHGQRLGQSNRKAGLQEFESNKKIYESFHNLIDAIQFITDPEGQIADKLNPVSPSNIFDRIMKFNFNTMENIIKALSGDPPRSDYTLIAMPQTFTGIPRITAGAGVSAKRAHAANDVMAAALDALVQLRAAAISQDRLGGAMQARDDAWTVRQAAAVVHYKKAAGLAMLTLAARLDALVQTDREEGLPDVTLSASQARASQTRLRAGGFAQKDLEAGRILGLTDAELADCKAAWLASDPSGLDGRSFYQTMTEAADAIRMPGTSFYRLPAVELPAAPRAAPSSSPR
jgi:hypothetical protein